MLSKGFKIIAPKTFEVDIEDITTKLGHSIVQIDYASICKADIRYYLGNRDERVLGLKYPMRLIHEATGTVLKDPSGKFNIGDKVVLVPNICVCKNCDFAFSEDASLGVNYCPKALFASSNYDGFSTECINYPTSHLVRYKSDFVPGEIVVFSELISVCIASIRRLDSLSNKKIGIWGDGILGFILAHVLKTLDKTNEIVIIGNNADKLEKFQVERTYCLKSYNKKQLIAEQFDVTFECVGGEYSANAINQMIECTKFGGDIILTGVSENGALINTRRILERAVKITGSTRSNIQDFKKSIDLLTNSMDLQIQISKLLLSINTVENINDYYKVFELESVNRKLGKHVIKFRI